MGGAPWYKSEAYCSTNRRCTAAFRFLQGFKTRKAQPYMGGGGAYCSTNWRCTAVLFKTSSIGWRFLNSVQFVGLKKEQCTLHLEGEPHGPGKEAMQIVGPLGEDTNPT